MPEKSDIFTMSTFDSVLLGAVGALLTTFVLWLVSALVQRQTLKPKECLWLEVILTSNPPAYSLGRIRFNYLKKRHSFSGEYYWPTGRIRSHWKSRYVNYDVGGDKIYYIYEIFGTDGQGENHGFGFISFYSSPSEVGGTGYFFDADNDSAEKKKITYCYARKVAKELGIRLRENDAVSRADFIRRLYETSYGTRYIPKE